MADPAYAGFSTYSSGSVATTSVTLSCPTGTVTGDLMLMSLTGNSTTVPATPTGWKVFQTAIGMTAAQLVMYYKYATSSDVAGTTNYTFTVASGRWAGNIVSYRGVHPIIAKETANTTSSTITVPEIRSYTYNALILTIARDTTAAGVTNPVWSSTSGTIRGAATTTSATAANMTLALVEQVQPTPASNIRPNITCSGTNTKQMRVTVGLRPARTDPTPSVISDDFTGVADTAPGVRFAYTRVSLSGHTWKELDPSPAGGNPPTGDPGIVSEILKPRAATGASYPCLTVPYIPVSIVARFILDPSQPTYEQGVGVHIWGSLAGYHTPVPLHFTCGRSRVKVQTGNDTGGFDPLLFEFGDVSNGNAGSYPYPNNATLSKGVVQTVRLDFVDNTMKITPPVESGLAELTLTDTRLQTSWLGVERAVVFETERDLSTEPYNGFDGMDIEFVPAPVVSNRRSRFFSFF